MLRPDNINKIPKRFYSLDVLRGVASLSVVVWHWQHFFYRGTINPGYNVKLQPFYSILFLFYEKGHLAVDLFFSLSGFVFFWLYSENIREGTVNSKEFFLLRFSRLYPLHFLTLLLILSCQLISNFSTGDFIVYSFNDIYHFFLNIFFISSWGFENGLSFNGPIWSVSVEIILYIIFFVFSSLGGSRSLGLCFLVVLAATFTNFIPWQVRCGIISFFLGGISFLFYRKYINYISKKLIMVLISITLILWTLTVVSLNYNWGFISSPDFNFLQKLVAYFLARFPAILLFPLTIFTLVIIETYRGSLGRRAQFIGDITYSTYLIHFPLQVIFLLLLPLLSLEIDFFYTKLSFVIYFTILIVVSHISFKYFEKPIQLYLRNRYYQRAGIDEESLA